MGSWISYGLGSENQNLPGFVTICPSSSNGGPRNFSNAFLPAAHQGTAVGRAGQPAADARIQDLRNARLSPSDQAEQFSLLQSLNRAQSSPADDAANAVISSFELAWRMQMHAPEIMDIRRESKATQQLYGIDQPQTMEFGQQCLLARRLAEAGVRFVQISYADNTNNPRWDQHSDMPKHAIHARAVDRPIAGLLADLKQRGLLEDTLVWWGGEFGRNPFCEANGTGRDHNPRGFTHFLAGGGVKPGFAHGATDDFGHEAVQGKVHMRDLHASVLHLLGVDHERLTFKYAGRNFRLTDVEGRVVDEILV
jgi:uncharacterized protein (DUF1501 family)